MADEQRGGRRARAMTGAMTGWMGRRVSAPVLVLVASLLLTAAATIFVGLTARARDRARRQTAIQSVVQLVRGRLDTYVAMLHGASGLFAASEDVTREEFHRYVEQLELDQRYPGIQGIGYSILIPPGKRDSVVAAERASGFPDFHLWPDSAAAEAHAIVYLEPLDARNRAAIGYDMFSEPRRRAAMEQARDAGTAALSARVRLVQEITANKQAGFLVYLPVYRGGVVPKTVAERRAALVGFVYSPFRAGDLFHNVLAERGAPRAEVRVYDGDSARAGKLLYDSHLDVGRGGAAAADTVVVHTAVAGHPWTLAVTPLPDPSAWSARVLTTTIAVIGLLMSALLFIVTRSLAMARRAAERSEALRSQFYATMSHELRTPLNAIIGYNDLLLAEVYGPLAAEQVRGIEHSQRAARHLVELVNDVLDVSKLESGKMDVEVEEVRIPPLVEDLFTTIRPMSEEKGTALVLECDGSVPAVRTDPRRVRQILLNLLSNATKFGAGRPVRVRCHPRRRGGVSVEVADEGPGIAPEDLNRIFEEFVQLPNAAPGGTGLGLPISRRLAELLGGRLEVQSTVGRGSTFRLELPARAPERRG